MLSFLLVALALLIIATIRCSAYPIVSKSLLLPTQIVDLQDSVRKDILYGKNINHKNVIDSLNRLVLVDTSFFGYNSIHQNNIAIRNALLLSVLYFTNNDSVKSERYFNEAKELIDYNITSDGEWSEGASYYLYVEDMMNLYLEKVSPDSFLISTKIKARKWIERFMTPDNRLPPTGDTRRTKWSDSKYVDENTTILDNNNTLFKKDGMYVFVRHPSSIYKYIFNTHIHYDIGNIVIFYQGEQIVIPVGYPGSKLKSKHKLSELENQNSIFIKALSNPFWRIGYYRLQDVSYFPNGVKICYLVNGFWYIRLVKIENMKVIITDIGSDGINLNIDKSKCDIEVICGKKLSVKSGLHTDKDSLVIINDRVFIPNRDGVTSVAIKIKGD